MKASNKVAFNTGILYVKMFITAGIGLYSTRLILNLLGVTDYGIYNLIAGIVAMLSFLNAAMTTSTQRYLSFFQGKNNLPMQKKVFTGSLFLHIIIGFIIVAGLELLGLFLFSGFLNIPEERIGAAKTIYHFMSVTVFFSILSVPFSASLTAHENMMWIAIVNVIESIIKLGIVSLLFFIKSDKLIYYGLSTALVGIVSFILYAVYCTRKYAECSPEYKNLPDRPLIKELSSFAGWNLFGALCGVGRTQGLAVILNIFLGTTVNAAYGIANQVAGQVNFFSATMLRTLNPQIMKSEGANDRKRMLRLSMIASKFGFFLLAFIAIPCIFEMPAILTFWLKNVPDYTSIFCSLILISILTNQLTIGLQSAIQATGKIKIYQSIIGSLLILNLPIAYFLLKTGYSVYSVLVSYIIIEALCCIIRLHLLKILANLSIKEYFRNVFLKEIIPVLSSVIVCYGITHSMEMQMRFLFTITVSVLVFALSIYWVGLCKDEKEIVNKLSNKLFNKGISMIPKSKVFS